MKKSATFKGKCAKTHLHLKKLERELSQEALNYIQESDMYSLYVIGFSNMSAEEINEFVADFIRKGI